VLGKHFSCEFNWLYHAVFRLKWKIFFLRKKENSNNNKNTHTHAKTSLRIDFVRHFSGCPKDLNCIKFGRAEGPLPRLPPAPNTYDTDSGPGIRVF